uniref:Uncharacterized protein n=1 Tax=Lactuca sativa TaxID=4236 RepID=A0A9R1XIR1_LACSA|nr:hypothetical protein LSAT_V11C400215460 [Lactuca sativa]
MGLSILDQHISEMKHLKYFFLNNCIRVKNFPEELGCLECLQGLYIQGTSISHHPQNILLLKGLCISGSRQFLESCGFTSEIQDALSYCYVRLPIMHAPTEGVSSTLLHG